MYGEGAPQDYKQAANWYLESAEQGNVDAQYALGLMCSRGDGVPQDYRRSADWYRKSAEQGYADA